ncbi:hypothetical protein SDC9_193480 [bioreactor metagenome]|uniref:Uncharacterized protein n=1 Tax=bioreactor metagenome TaxID=1076179 RepID=A0A645I3N6_9ZZZZ
MLFRACESALTKLGNHIVKGFCLDMGKCYAFSGIFIGYAQMGENALNVQIPALKNSADFFYLFATFSQAMHPCINFDMHRNLFPISVKNLRIRKIKHGLRQVIAAQK